MARPAPGRAADRRLPEGRAALCPSA